LFSIHGDAVKSDGLEDLGTHDLEVRVLWQLEIEETSISMRKLEILFLVLIIWHDLELEVAVIDWKTILSPAELYELPLLIFRET